ncbi:hypothetical protein ABEB36_009392 [Hypothenemus hampei]|uniref:Uncharacterized protein n=1 Tax=Hypothenemus hampei TaxID=57062 RepID=A0ABD1EKC0_HYPHA
MSPQGQGVKMFIIILILQIFFSKLYTNLRKAIWLGLNVVRQEPANKEPPFKSSLSNEPIEEKHHLGFFSILFEEPNISLCKSGEKKTRETQDGFCAVSLTASKETEFLETNVMGVPQVDENEFSMFGKLVATQLKTLPLYNGLLCKEKIEAILIQERLQLINYIYYM